VTPEARIVSPDPGLGIVVGGRPRRDDTGRQVRGENAMDKRTSSRSKVAMAGAIEFGDISINCMVRDVSNIGATLELTAPHDIPRHVTLVLMADIMRLPSHVVWRKSKRVGIAFDWIGAGC
jgi:hypothetical protein